MEELKDNRLPLSSLFRVLYRTHFSYNLILDEITRILINNECEFEEQVAEDILVIIQEIRTTLKVKDYILAIDKIGVITNFCKLLLSGENKDWDALYDINTTYFYNK